MATWTPTSAGQGTALSVDYYGRTGWYGSDSVDPDNPEIVGADDTQVDLNFFGTGIHAYTKWSGGSDGWDDTGVVLLRDAGSFAGGQGALAEIRIKKQFLLDAVNDYAGGEGAPLIAVAGEQYFPANAKVIVRCHLVSGSGTGSVWRFDVEWEKFSNGSGQTSSSANVPYADLLVGTTRDIVLRVQCTSAHQTEFPVSPQDGSISLTMDGVSLVNVTGIDPYLNWQSGNPSALNSWNAVGLGFSGLLGPIWMVAAGDAFTDDAFDTDDIPQDYSTGCCSGDAAPGTSSTGTTSGDPTRSLQPWTVQCDGGGTVPSESDPSASEAWA